MGEFRRKLKAYSSGVVYINFKSKRFQLAVAITLIMGLLLGAGSKVMYEKKIAYDISTQAFVVRFDGENLGIVRSKEQAEATLKEIKIALSDTYDIQIAIKQNLSYEPTHAEDHELITKSDLKNSIRSKLTFNVWAYGLEVNGHMLAVVKSEEQAKKIIEKVKEPYILEAQEENSKIEEIKISEDVQIVKKQVPISTVQDFERALAIIQRGTDEEKTHIVQKGESYWSIAHKYKLSVEDLERANPGKKAAIIQPGDEVSLIVPKPYLTVATYETKTYIDKVPYDTKYEYTSSLYEDQIKTKRSGKEGEIEVVAKVEKRNGIEVAKEILKQTLIAQPVAQIKVKGTKEAPPKKGLGTFITPTRGTLTSKFGPRWGSFHSGIDLASRTGTPIKAADGGVVSFAGWKGNYGYLVEIDHGKGFKTRYAHCSKIYVKKGQKVYQDQTIAAVGNTGRSTGPHVHFEVLKYGTAQNPYKYIGKRYSN